MTLSKVLWTTVTGLVCAVFCITMAWASAVNHAQSELDSRVNLVEQHYTQIEEDLHFIQQQQSEQAMELQRIEKEVSDARH